MALNFKKINKNQEGTEFIDIGNVKTFIENYGECVFIPKKWKKRNMTIHIYSEQGIEFKLICSKALSDIIREDGFTNKFLKKFYYYRICKITGINGNTYIRITENWTQQYNENKSEAWNENKLKSVKGNAQLLYVNKKSDVELKPRQVVVDWKDLIVK